MVTTYIKKMLHADLKTITCVKPLLESKLEWDHMTKINYYNVVYPN
jgi:hypothetical protein